MLRLFTGEDLTFLTFLSVSVLTAQRSEPHLTPHCASALTAKHKKLRRSKIACLIGIRFCVVARDKTDRLYVDLILKSKVQITWLVIRPGF